MPIDSTPHALRIAPISLLALQLLSAPMASAQLALEEVIVTAQKRSQSLQDVPVAVLAMSGETLDDNGIVDLEEATLAMPNVNINKGAATPNLYIRGVGSGTNAGFEQSVGMYIDGIYSGRGQLAAVPITMDLARIEVLKGPQGVLFGKNTIGGAINITTTKPAYEFDAYVDALYTPDDGEQVLTAVVGGEVTENIAGRFAVRYEAMDGWWDNVALDEEGPDKNHVYGRASLLWDASEEVEVLIKYEKGDFDLAHKPAVIYASDQPVNFEGNQPFPLLDEAGEGAYDGAATDKTETDVFALTVNRSAGYSTLTSITGYAAYETDRLQDPDFSVVPGLHRRYEEEYTQYSQELRLVSPGDESFDWILGAYYQYTELDISRQELALDLAKLGPLAVPALVGLTESLPTVFDQDSHSWAAFAQLNWSLAENWRFGLGLRYDREEKDVSKISDSRDIAAARADTSGPAVDLIVRADPATSALIGDLRSHRFLDLTREENAFTWSGVLQWYASDDAMLYASVSTGFKGGGYDEAYNLSGPVVRTGNIITGEPDGGLLQTGVTPSDIEYGDESVLSLELGAKMTLADGAATLNLAAFLMEYEDLQVSSLEGDVYRVNNAGEATSAGIEIDGRWMLAPGLSLGGSVAYLDATYDDFSGANCTTPQTIDPLNNPGCLNDDGSNILPGETGGQDLSGETLLFAPEWSYNLNAEWVVPVSSSVEFRVTGEVNYTDEFYSALDLDPQTVHDSNVRVNARLALAAIDDRWSVALIGKNLTDEETRLWSNDVATTASNTYFGIPERPRSVSIQARYRF